MSWPVNDDGTRKRSLRRFPYSVWFEVQGNTVTVIAVAHHRATWVLASISANS